MPRYARMLNDKKVYHIMLRGNNREKIFIDDDDKKKIIDILKDKKQDEAFSLFAYCVMDNHIHLAIREGENPLARIVKRIGVSYAHYFNKKYKRIGHVFQDRYRSENIEDEQYLLAVIRYIHQNPVKAGIGTIDGYEWSSYNQYIMSIGDMLETGEILELFSLNRMKAIEEFIEFNQQEEGSNHLDIQSEKEIDESNAAEFINNYLEQIKAKKLELKEPANKQIREELIKELVNRSKLSLREIARILGLNGETVRRIVSKEPSL